MFKIISTLEKRNLINDLGDDIRNNDRSMEDYRSIQINPLYENGQVEVKIGNTTIITQIFSSLVSPNSDRPSEGNIVFSIDTNHLRHSSECLGNSDTLNEMRNKLNNLLEKGLRDSKALDTQSLCIVPNKLCWKIVIDINIVNNDGNLYTACFLACLASWVSYKVPFLRKVGNTVNLNTKTYINLSLLHMPICITTGILEDKTLVDPDLNEEKIIDGVVLVVANRFSEVVYLHTYSSSKVNRETMNDIMEISKEKIEIISKIIKKFREKVNNKSDSIIRQNVNKIDANNESNDIDMLISTNEDKKKNKREELLKEKKNKGDSNSKARFNILNINNQ